MTWAPLLQRLRRPAAHGTLPRWSDKDAKGTAGSHHVVQFYGGKFPASTVADFMREGISQGEKGVVIATPEHCDAVRKLLSADADGCRFLHAGRALDRFVEGEKPNEALFDSTIGQVVRDAAAEGNGHVRAYGEMVVILCQRRNPEAAFALERMWNRLGSQAAFTLLCSYPLDTFSGENRPHLARLRQEHRHAIVA